jgi:hypothetical protein
VGLGFLCFLVAAAAFCLSDFYTIASLQTQQQHYVDAGGATRILTAQEAVVATACDSLSTSDGVDAAGALAAADPIRLDATPTVTIQAYAVTMGFAGVVGVANPAPVGVWLDQGLASVLDARVGTVLATTAGPLVIGGVFGWPNDGRDQRLSFSVLVPTAAVGYFDECWMKAWPSQDSNDLLLRSAQAVQPGGPVNPVGQVNASMGRQLESAKQFASRTPRFTPIALLVMGLALGYAQARARRLEQASNLHAGVSKGSLVTTCLLETGAWVFPGIICSFVILLAAVRLSGDPSAVTVLPVLLPGPSLAGRGALLGSVISCLQTRERHLFRLFRDR